MNRWLREPIQRALFAFGCAALLPWIFLRLPSEIFQAGNLGEYVRDTVLRPWECLVSISHSYGCGGLGWHDHLMPFGMVTIALAFLWPKTMGRLIAWIVGPH
jgi:hypothetical protein